MSEIRQDSVNPSPDPETVTSAVSHDLTAHTPFPPTEPLTLPTLPTARGDQPIVAPHSDGTITYPPMAATPPSATPLEEMPTSPGGRMPPVGSHAPPAVTRMFGDYELLEVIARGGMGIVYKARQKKLQRIVALKMILAGDLASSQEIERFHMEAEAAAQLDHPGIVPIFEVGENGGQRFFSMGYVEGGSLSRRIKDGPLPPRDSAALLLHVAEAVHYAHGKGIIHRDLKPGNVLLDNTGQPKVSDFGLAKRVTGASQLTTAGQVLGTPSYMPPEQASGKIDEVRAPADIYSLGAILYCLLTARPPFHAANPVETLKQVLEQEPLAPRQLNSVVDRDLDTVCLKCLQKDPGKRYATAQALADDLRRYLAGDPILARPVGRTERLWRWCRRNPVTAVLLAIIVVAIMCGVGFSLYYAAEAGRALGIAQEKEKQARFAQLVSEHRRYAAELSLAHRDWQDARLDPMLKRLDALLPPDAETPDLRGFEWYYLKRLGQLDFATLQGHTAPVLSVAYSKNGRWLASAGGELTGQGEVKLWDIATGQAVRSLEAPPGKVWAVVFSADGHLLAAGSETTGWAGEIRIWDVATGQLKHAIKGQLKAVRALAFSPDGTRLFSAGGGYKVGGSSLAGEVKAWDVETGKPALSPLTRNVGQVQSLALSPDGRWLALAGFDMRPQSGGTVEIHDLNQRQDTVELDAHPSTVSSVAFSPDGRYLATGSADQTVKVWNFHDGKPAPRHTLRHAGQVKCIAFSVDGTRLAVGSDDHRVTLWEVSDGRQVRRLQGHAAIVHAVTFSPDGWCLASGSADRTVKVWDSTMNQEIASLDTAIGTLVYQVAFQPGGAQVALATSYHTVRVWDRTTGEELRALRGHAEKVLGVAYSPDGGLLASGGEDRTVRIWVAATGKQRAVLTGHDGMVQKVTFNSRGDSLASCSVDGTVRLWDVAGAKVRHTLSGHEGAVWNVTFSPDGNRLASAGADTTVRIWDTTSGQLLLTLRQHAKAVWSVAYSPDGLTLASTGEDHTVRLWDAATGQHLACLDGPVDKLRDVKFSPDGRRLAVTGAGRVKVWDTFTRQEVFLLRGPQVETMSVAFSPDGYQLATAGQSKSDLPAVVIWDGTPLTPELRDQREAHSLVRLLVPMPLSKDDVVAEASRDKVIAQLNQDPGLRELVRQRALSLVQPRLQARFRAEAEFVVCKLFEERLLRPEVMESLRADATLSQPVRQEALRLAEDFVESSKKLNSTSLAIVGRPDATSADYALALRQAEVACRLAAYNGEYQTTRGMALYRLARYPEAVDALTQADGLLGKSTPPATLAFLAMAQYQHKQRDQAHKTMLRLQSLMQEARWAKDQNAIHFLAEAKTLLSK